MASRSGVRCRGSGCSFHVVRVRVDAEGRSVGPGCHPGAAPPRERGSGLTPRADTASGLGQGVVPRAWRNVAIAWLIAPFGGGHFRWHL
jgi:hypothetical protein